MLDVIFNAATSYRGTAGGLPVTSNGAFDQTNMLATLRLSTAIGGGFDVSVFGAAGAAFLRPTGAPTGIGGPQLVGGDTVAALRVGIGLSRQVSDTVALGAQLAYQRTERARIASTLPGEEFDFGNRDSVLASFTISFNPPPPPPRKPAVEPPPRTPSRSDRPATREGGGKPPPTPPTLSDTTPVTDDPKDGIPVEGGKLHRSTGTYGAGDDKRSALICWVEVDGTAKCKDFRFYQWACAEIVSVDWGDGKGAVKPEKVSGKVVYTATGAKLKVNEWSADDHGWTKKFPKKKMFTGPAVASCPEPKRAPEAAPYGALPPSIPGAPEVKDNHDPKNEQKWLQQFVDAPSMATGAAKFMSDIFGNKGKTTSTKPAVLEEQPVTLVMKYHFRVALYCDKDCLGTFEWTAEETVVVTPTWVPSPGLIPDSTKYELTYNGKRTRNPAPKVGKWKEPC
jgi:hypothetical protein